VRTELLADSIRMPGNAPVDSLVRRLKAVIDDHQVEPFEDRTRDGEPPGRESGSGSGWNLLEICPARSEVSAVWTVSARVRSQSESH
jgi:hypothetical protein